MYICLTIEKDKYLWTKTLYTLHLLGFKWHKTERSLDEFDFIDGMLKYDAKGLGINLKDKTVASAV